MKLIEKIISALYTTSSANYAAELIEKIADDFAVDFKEWCDECYLYNMENFTAKELLEIYKKFKNDYDK